MPYPSSHVVTLPLPGPSYIFGLPGPSGFGAASTAEQVAQVWDGRGTVVAITGATAGLGAEAARVLASRGATVVLLVRNVEAGAQVAERIRATSGAASGGDVRVVRCDLEDLASVAQAAQAFLDLKLPLHVLMLNAGVMAVRHGLTPQGFERHIGINHVAHALLTRLLLPAMVQSAQAPGAPPGRIVCLSSIAHYYTYWGGFRRDADLASPRWYDSWAAYGQSKLANLLFARELAARLAAAGVRNLTAVSVHPGCIIDTQLWRELPLGPLVPVLRAVARGTLKTAPQGAATQVWAATTPTALPPGAYLQDCNVAGTAKVGVSTRLGARLWAWTDAATKGFVPKETEAGQPFRWADPQPPALQAANGTAH